MDAMNPYSDLGSMTQLVLEEFTPFPQQATSEFRNVVGRFYSMCCELLSKEGEQP
jgi:hypothetical protein